jgi:predicted HTH transcriptional regulator
MTNSWDINTIQSYIDNQVEENLNLDYKAADALQKTEGKKKDISKDVSAMANAAGGIIIYGTKEFDEITKRHLPEKIDPVNRTDISKEWLEQVINTNVQPKIEGIIITPVTVDDTKGTVVYIVEVPQSTTAHQANDKKYYKRYNFESVPMEDYEIRDIMSRLKHPDVTLKFILERTQRIERDFLSGRIKQPHFNILTNETT